MSDAITVGTVVRLRRDTPAAIAGAGFIGLVERLDGGRASVVRGPPGDQIRFWIPLYDLEPVPWEELGEVGMVLVA